MHAAGIDGYYAGGAASEPAYSPKPRRATDDAWRERHCWRLADRLAAAIEATSGRRREWAETKHTAAARNRRGGGAGWCGTARAAAVRAGAGLRGKALHDGLHEVGATRAEQRRAPDRLLITGRKRMPQRLFTAGGRAVGKGGKAPSVRPSVAVAAAAGGVAAKAQHAGNGSQHALKIKPLAAARPPNCILTLSARGSRCSCRRPLCSASSSSFRRAADITAGRNDVRCSVTDTS